MTFVTRWKHGTTRVVGALGLILALSIGAQAQRVTTIEHNGPSENRIDLVILPEGYTENERDLIFEDANRLIAHLFETGNAAEPFRTYRNFFNIHVIEIFSNQSGADYTILQKGQEVDIEVDTAMDARLESVVMPNEQGQTSGTRRAEIDLQKARSFVRALDFKADMKFVPINVSFFGGWGNGGFATYSAGQNRNAGPNDANNSENKAVHELGHAYAKLADEYFTANTEWPEPTIQFRPPTCGEPNYDRRLFPQFYPNVAVDTNTPLPRVPWQHWIGFDDPQTGEVGTHEGGFKYATGVVRPSESSLMRFTNWPLDPVGKEQFVLRFYNDVRPLDDHTPSTTGAQNLWYVESTPIDPQVIATQWSMDGAELAGQTAADLDLCRLAIFPGDTKQITLRAADAADFVRLAPMGSSGRPRTTGALNSPLCTLDRLARTNPGRLRQAVTWTVNYTQTRQVGGPSADSFTATPNGGALCTYGGEDTLIGSEAADYLYGGDEDDVITPNGGVDVIRGGAGADTITFRAARHSPTSAPDVIVDFDTTAGDRIDLSRFDADTTVFRKQSFNFIRYANFSGTPGELRVAFLATFAAELQGDVDGDAVADFVVQLPKVTDLAEDDLILGPRRLR